jgi:hypothetical protein
MWEVMVRLLTTHEAALALRLSERTLERLRVSGDGPAFLKLGKRVLYRECDLESWVVGQRRSNTSERPTHDRRRCCNSTGGNSSG